VVVTAVVGAAVDGGSSVERALTGAPAARCEPEQPPSAAPAAPAASTPPAKRMKSRRRIGAVIDTRSRLS
jgi:hypothetical protein